MDRLLGVLALCLLVAAVAFALRRRSSSPLARLDPVELGLAGSGVAVVAFSSPYCAPCRAWEAELTAGGIEFAKVDVGERPELASRWGISETPLVLAVHVDDGRVLASYGHEPQPDQIEHLKKLAGTVQPAKV